MRQIGAPARPVLLNRDLLHAVDLVDVDLGVKSTFPYPQDPVVKLISGVFRGQVAVDLDGYRDPHGQERGDYRPSDRGGPRPEGKYAEDDLCSPRPARTRGMIDMTPLHGMILMDD